MPSVYKVLDEGRFEFLFSSLSRVGHTDAGQMTVLDKVLVGLEAITTTARFFYKFRNFKYNLGTFTQSIFLILKLCLCIFG